MIISAEYEEEKRKLKAPWWRFWAKKGTTTTTSSNPSSNPTDNSTGNNTDNNTDNSTTSTTPPANNNNNNPDGVNDEKGREKPWGHTELIPLLALVWVLVTMVWIVSFHAQKVRLKDPQMIISAEYMEDKREERTPWWKLWAKKANNNPAATANTEDASNKPSPRLAILCGSPPAELPGSGKSPTFKGQILQLRLSSWRHGAHGDSVFHLTSTSTRSSRVVSLFQSILCDRPPADSGSGESPHVQKPNSGTRFEFVAPRGLRLPSRFNADSK
ncbi:hypothetical protein VN97_g1791 [Penicillium thymicola]|uniref:Uncharacterized protein n=1 Tax=Penicillium thymicola TaxID=293382 RepID=A0AAI9XCV1_PENTH|nr:hypothetical protein VN97_g1791 [Penicillium thymicola]